MQLSAIENSSPHPPPPGPFHKAGIPLPVGFLTNPAHGPRMVKRGADKAFELYLELRRSLYLEQSSEGTTRLTLKPLAERLALPLSSAGPALSRLLKQLRDDFELIDYVPRRGQAPVVRLRNLSNPSAPFTWTEDSYVRVDPQFWTSRHTCALPLRARFFLLVTFHEVSRNVHKKESYGCWWRSLELIEDRYHVSKQTASKALNELEARGLVRIHRPERKDAPRLANVYRFLGFDIDERRPSPVRPTEDYAAFARSKGANEDPSESEVEELARAFVSQQAEVIGPNHLDFARSLLSHYGSEATWRHASPLRALHPNNPWRTLYFLRGLLTTEFYNRAPDDFDEVEDWDDVIIELEPGALTDEDLPF